MQLKAGDLGEKEYLELRSKEAIENSASSFGKILFKKPAKKNKEEASTSEAAAETSEIAPRASEIDLIFNLDKEGKEKPADETEQGDNSETVEAKKPKKILLDDEEDKEKTYGLQEPPVKKRFIDRVKTKVETLPAKKVLERESKAGNKKLLSFYDEEEEEFEEYNREVHKEKLKKQEEQNEESD